MPSGLSRRYIVENLEATKDWLYHLNGFSAIAGILFFIYVRKSLKSVSGIIFIILLVSFLADNINYFFIRFVYPNGFIVGNLWIITNYFLMMWLFKKILTSQSSKTVLVLTVLFTIGSLVSLYFYTLTEANTFINVYSTSSFIIVSLIAYLELLKNPSSRLIKQPIFWIATAFFVHNSLILLQSIFENYLIFDQQITKEAYRVIQIINLIANTTKNYVLFYALVLIYKGFPDSIATTNSK